MLRSTFRRKLFMVERGEKTPQNVVKGDKQSALEMRPYSKLRQLQFFTQFTSSLFPSARCTLILECNFVPFLDSLLASSSIIILRKATVFCIYY